MRVELLEEQMRVLRDEFEDEPPRSRSRSRSRSCCKRGKVSRVNSSGARYSTATGADGTIHVSQLPKKKIPRRTRPWCATAGNGVPTLREDPQINNPKVKQHSLLWDRIQGLSEPNISQEDFHNYHSHDHHYDHNDHGHDHHHDHNDHGRHSHDHSGHRHSHSRSHERHNHHHHHVDYIEEESYDDVEGQVPITFRQGWSNNLNTPPKDCVLVSEVYPRLVAVTPPAIPPMGTKQETVSTNGNTSPRNVSPIPAWTDASIQLSPSRRSRQSASPAHSPRDRSHTPQPQKSPPKATIAVGTDDVTTSVVVSCQTSDTLLKTNPRSASPPISPKRNDTNGPVVTAARASYKTTAPPVVGDSYKRPPHLNVDRPRSNSLASSRRPSASSFVKSPSFRGLRHSSSDPIMTSPARRNSGFKGPPEGSGVKQPTIRKSSLVGIRRVSIGSTPPGTPVSMKIAPSNPTRTPPSPYITTTPR